MVDGNTSHRCNSLDRGADMPAQTMTVAARLHRDEVADLVAQAERSGMTRSRFIAEAVRRALAEPTPSPT